MSVNAGPTSHFYFSQRLRLHYVDWGNDAARPLLLIHGGRDHARSWDWVAQELRTEFHIIAPDLRGHGDSEWATGSSYPFPDSIYDIAQLVERKGFKKVSIIAHSLGGAISLLFAGAFPELVERLVVIEGVWLPQRDQAKQSPIEDRVRRWVDFSRAISGRNPRRYASIDEATQRMIEANPRLTQEQARHLTMYGTNQNEDGSYSWKYDNYIRIISPYRFSTDEVQRLWSRITCPTLLIRGTESDAPDPVANGSIKYFPTAKTAEIAAAGHWVHHDKLDEFLALSRNFLK
jgi:pimeloyl-ACP methyl ester carboxylesterase